MNTLNSCEINILADVVASKLALSKSNCCKNNCNTSFTLFTENSSSVVLSGAGTSDDPLIATVVISEDDGNILESRSNGLYVSGNGINPFELVSENTTTVDLLGLGTSGDPLTASVKISNQLFNALSINSDGLYVPVFLQNGIIWGGITTNVSGYTYEVSDAFYVVGGVPHTFAEDTFTLAASDLTYDRFDLPVLTHSGTVQVITGVPSINPQIPSYDPLTQVPLVPILVTAGSVSPVIPQQWIYRENVEWTTLVSSPTINAASVITPYAGTLDIESTNSLNGHNIRFTAPVVPTMSDYNVLTFKIKSKGIWSPSIGLIIQFYNGLSPVGASIILKNNTLGFDSSNTIDYQTMSIPLALFGSPSAVTSLLFTVQNTDSASIPVPGFYIDDIQLQGADIPNTDDLFFRHGGNGFGSTAILGTRDNFPLSVITNNTERSVFGTDGVFTHHGNVYLNGTDPAISFYTGTLAGSDYYIKRQGTTLAVQAAGIVDLQINQRSGYTVNANVLRGHEWYDMDSPNEVIAQLLPSGAYKLKKYGVNTFAGAPAYALGVTATGDVVEFAVTGGGGAYTVDNGLNPSTPTNFQLGGPLTSAVTIDAGTLYKLNVIGNSTQHIVHVVNSGNGNAVRAQSNSVAITAISIAGTALSASGITRGVSSTATGVTGIGVFGSGNQHGGEFVVTGGTASNVGTVLRLYKSIVSPENGVGSSITMGVSSVVSSPTLTLESKYTNITLGSYLTEFNIRLLHGNSIDQACGTVFSTGQWKYNQYGSGTFSGTAAYILAVDSSGNIIEVTSGGGGGENLQQTLTIGSVLNTDHTISFDGFNLNIEGTNDMGMHVNQNGGDFSDAGGTGLFVDSSPGSVDIRIAGTNWFTVNQDTAKAILGRVDAGFPRFELEQTGPTNSALLFNADLTMSLYGTGTISGTLAYLLGVDASGLVIEINPGSIGSGGADTLAIEALTGTGFAVRTAADTWALRSITGTTNRISITNPAGVAGDVIIDIDSNYSGQPTITTLGTISAGTWNANTIAHGKGGTGHTSYLAGQVLIGKSDGSLAKTTLTDGTGIVISEGDGTITISSQFNHSVQSSSSSSLTWDVANGETMRWTITGTTNTLAISGAVAGRYYTLEVIQGDGNNTVSTWPGGIVWFGGIEPTLSTNAGDIDYIIIFYDGITYTASFNPVAGLITPLIGGGTGASLTDPGVDRILFWDDSAGAVTWLEVGSGLTITGTVLSIAAGGSNANTGLSNLAAVAINTSLISDTNNTDDLGSASIRWKDVHAYSFKAGAGTTTVAPIVLTAGTSLTTPTAGSVEYDGVTAYMTTASGRGVVPSIMFVRLTADDTLSNVNTEQPAFDTSNDIWTFQGSTTYYFEGVYILTHLATAHSLSLSFVAGGGATITSISYNTICWVTAIGTNTASQTTNVIQTASATAVNSSGANANETVRFSGHISIGTGGTIQPSITFSAAPGGTVLMKAGSYIRFTPVGSNTVESVGSVG